MTTFYQVQIFTGHEWVKYDIDHWDEENAKARANAMRKAFPNRRWRVRKFEVVESEVEVCS
jgi:hypothetical protein